MTTAEKIGARIKMRREELKITQQELGDKLGLNKSTILRYEAGAVNKIKIPIMHAMAQQLDVDPNWLILKTDICSPYKNMSTDNSGEDKDSELQEYLEELKNRDEMKMLFSLAKGATKEDVMKAVKIIEALQKDD